MSDYSDKCRLASERADLVIERDALKAERDSYRTALEKIANTEYTAIAALDARDVLAKYAVTCPIDDKPCHPSTCTFGKRDYANVTKRNGDPIVVDGKIVRLPVKRSCANCTAETCDSRGHAYAHPACDDWRPRRG